MNWTLAIEHNRAALLGLLAKLFALVDASNDESPNTLPRHVRATILHFLRPAESAVLRLIIVTAYVLGIKAKPCENAAKRRTSDQRTRRGDGKRVPAFPLFDKRRRRNKNTNRRSKKPSTEPTIHSFDEPFVPASVTQQNEVSPDDPVNAESLRARLQSLKNALEDLPKQARRLVQARARREAQGNRKSPMRGGRPPGHRENGKHEIDEILRDCQTLALWALAAPDTS